MAKRRVLLLAIAAALVAAATGAAAAPSLRSIVLSPAQVGVGYRMSVIPGGTVVNGQVTLDLCGATFPSESLRVARLQVSYARPGRALQISNEVVRYQPGDAQQALREVTHAANHCPRGPVQGPIAGTPPVTYRLTKITDPRLLPGYLALRVHLTGNYQGKRVVVNAVGVYQAKGDVFSGVYTNGHGTPAAQLQLGLHAAEESAKNLRRLA